jgi:EAL domain-containing protein (putative c-di-GMP-specific phosphodiesterase class I)
VEDAVTLELLISMQINFAQGYYFSAAQPAEFWPANPGVIADIQTKAQRHTRVSPSPSPAIQLEAELSAMV